MKVKVICGCGAKFEFEVTPVNGRMPVSLNCPVCGADATALANDVIARQSQVQAAAPSASPMRVAISPRPAAGPAPPAPPIPPPVAAGQAGLRISRSSAEPPKPVYEGPADLPEAGIEPCHRHPSEAAVDHCVVCGKAICEKCRQQFGHVCSIFCREAAAHKNVEVPVYAGQRGQVEARAERRVRDAILAGIAMIALLAAAAAWYTWFARDPKVAYSVPLAAAGPARVFELIAPGRLVSVKDGRVELLDVAHKTPVWTVSLPADAVGPSDYYGLRVIATTNDIWLAFADQVLRLNAKTGSREDLSLPDNIHEVIPGTDALLVLSGVAGRNEQVTKISLADGSLQTEPTTATGVKASPTSGNPDTRPSATNGPRTTTQRIRTMAGASESADQPTARPPESPPPPATRQEISAAGPNAVLFTANLLEQRTVTVQAMKKKGASVLDSSDVTASQGVDYAEEMLNDSRREETGGVDVEDVSRYQVTLHRLFAGGLPDWTGEVTGPPHFVALKDVDLLVAGTNLSVFDKHNKKLWDAILTYPPSDAEAPPCLQTADALYFADKGMLTRFDLLSGSPRWRLTSVGISGITMDDRGSLYVDTTTADAETIRYSQQINLHKQVQLAIERVDPETGKVLWTTRFDGDRYRALPSGKFLFTSREWLTQDPLRLEEGPDVNFNIKLVKPFTGDMIWNYPVARKDLIKVQTRENWILLQFQDEVRVLTFWSL